MTVPNYSQPLLTGANISSVWYKFFTTVPTVAGTYNGTFKSGQLQYSGPNGTLTGSNNFIVGTDIPTPGSPYPNGGAAMLLGSGGGGGTPTTPGTPVSFWIVQDAPFDNYTPGNNLGISAGESDGAQPGGTLTGIGGASATGTGGPAQWQGGTSKDNNGGPAIVQGGNSTNGIPGDGYLSGGQTGIQGANAHLIMTTINGISGVVRIRNNSTPLIDFYADGSIYLYQGGGFGTTGQTLTSQGPGQPVKWA